MKNNIKGVLNYIVGFLILYGVYVNTGGFFNVSIFYFWVGGVILVFGTLVINTNTETLYEIAKDMPRRPYLYHLGLNIIDFLIIATLAYNGHYFYAGMVIILWLISENMLKTINSFDIQKYEESQKWIAGLFKDIDDGIKKS